MDLSTKTAALVSCGVLATVVFELVRKKRMREEYSLIWFGVTIGLAAAVILDRFTLRVIQLLGGANPSSLFFFGGIFFSVLMLVHLTVRISELKRKQNVLIQESGLLRLELEQLRRGLGQQEPGEELQQRDSRLGREF